MKQIRLSYSFLILLLAFSHSIATDVGNGLKPFRSTTKSRIAFLVGINSYKATTSLKYAVGDSEAIEDLLLRTGKYDKLIKLNDYGKITTTLNPETLSYSSQRIKMAPTKANIEAVYQEVLAANPDTLLFYYSGHGFIEGEGGENFIAPKDVDVKFEKKKVGKEEKQVPVPLNGISLKVMGVQAAKVKRVVFLIDACRSPLPEADGEEEVQIADAGKKELTIARLMGNESDGGKSTKVDLSKDAKSTKNTIDIASKESKVETEKELVRNIISVKTEVLPKRVLEAEGITMLIGAAPEVSSLEDEDFKSGIFTHFLKKAFNGGVQEENQEEYITEENLSRYIEDRFKHYYELRKKESELAAEPKLYNLTFDRGKKGEILISQHRPIEGKERIEKPIYTDTIRKREVKGKLVYNEKGEREDLRFFVHDKKRDLYYPDSLDGVYKMEYSFNKDKSGELEKFTATEFNLENEEVFEYGTKLIPDVGWEYRGIYNDRNVGTGIIGVETGLRQPGRVSTSTEQIRFERKVFDFNGNIISEEYFDANGKPLEFGGVAKIVRAYDKYGQVVLEEFYSKDILDEYGDVAEKGKLIAKDGFARYKAKYKSKGNLLYETWEDVEGKIVNNKFGYAKTKYIYDKNDRLIRKKFYDLENKPANDKSGVSVYSYSYDSNCIGLYESKIAEIAKKDNKTALKDWKLGKYKLCLSEEVHTDKDGKPANEINQYYKRQRKFDKKGYLVYEESFRPDGVRFLQDGVAQIIYAYDKNDNILSKKNFGEVDINKKLIPIFDGNGVHEYRYTYQEYFNYDGKPILNECIYYRKEKGILLEPYGCALKIEHYGINGKPIEDKREVYRTNIYYTGAYQEEADRLYYALSDKFILGDKKEKFAYNPYGNLTIDADYRTEEGKDFLKSKYESKYDERNNRISDANYVTIEGKEVLVWKTESKYDERNNRTLGARYETREGKEALVSKKENKFNERNKKTLEADYQIIEGKEVPVSKEESEYDEKNNNTLVAKYETKEGKLVPVWKEEYKYDERNNITLQAKYETIEGALVQVWKYEHRYDERNNVTLEAYYRTIEGKEVLVSKKEYKYDERNNKTLKAEYETKEGKEVLVWKEESKYDERNNEILSEYYQTIDGALVLVSKSESKYNERNNKTLYAYYKIKEGKEALYRKEEHKYDKRNNETLSEYYEAKEGALVLVSKSESKYDEMNNKTLEAKYETKEGALVLVSKSESKYDERNKKTLEAKYETKEGALVLVSKFESKYDERNNKTLEAYYGTIEGKEIPVWKEESKYDERNNKTLVAKYETKEGELVLVWKEESKYDEKNNGTFFAKYIGKEEALEEKITVDFRMESFSVAYTQYKPKSEQIEARLAKIKYSEAPKDLSEIKSLNQNLEDLKKDFESKMKKYTLTEEKFGKNEKLKSASYKLLFFNPRGPADKRLMRVDLDQFYRPVKVGFEEE